MTNPPIPQDAPALTAQDESTQDAPALTAQDESTQDAPAPTAEDSPAQDAPAPTAEDSPAQDDTQQLDMGQLLDSAEIPEPRTLRRGEVVDGSVMNVDPEGVLVDIGSKSEGIVPTNEMHSLGSDPPSKINVGDEILVYVLQAETDEGQVLLSIDRARGEQGWRELQQRFESGDSFEAEVTGFNKGGLLANVEGVNAFIPMSQVVGAKPGTDGATPLSEQVGRHLRLKVIEINRRRNRVILSERAALQEWRAAQKDRLLDELTEGEIREGSVTSIRNFGVFVDLGGADGLVHLSELSWDRNVAVEEMLSQGDKVNVYVMKVDRESKKIALSIRRAAPEQWQELITQYAVGDVVPAVVTKLVAFGAFARLPGPVEGLVHVSEFVERRIGHPQEVVEEDDVLPLKIVRIEHDRHRLGLSLREARQEAEIRGWGFDDDGRVVAIAEEGSEAFPDEAAAVNERMESRRAEQSQRAPAPEQRADGDTPDEARDDQQQAPPMTAMAAAMQQAQAQFDAAAEPEASAEPEAAVEPEASAEPEAAVEPEASAEPEAAAEPEASAEPDASAKPDASAEPEAAVELEASAEPDAASEAEQREQ